jgi:hypothetical protein
LIGIINKPLVLHLVGCLYYFVSMMRGQTSNFFINLLNPTRFNVRELKCYPQSAFMYCLWFSEQTRTVSLHKFK